MSTRKCIWALLLATMVFSSGCMSRLAKEGLGAATGAKGSFSESPSMGPGGAKPLAGYQDFQVGNIENTFKLTPRELIPMLKTEIRKDLQKQELPTGRGGKTCVINVSIFYYEKAGTMGQVFGPLEEVVADVQLVDKSDDRVIGTAVCVGRSTTTSNQGVEKKAQGLAKGIVNWIQSRYPEKK